jgi:hypothetical protein
MSAPTPTPRTDYECVQIYTEDVTGCANAVDYVPASFARGLETELAAERERLDWLDTKCEPEVYYRQRITGEPEQEHVSNMWSVRGQCYDLRAAIDAAMNEDAK